MQPPVARVTAVSHQVCSQPLKIRLGELSRSLRRRCACFPTPSRPGRFCPAGAAATVGCCSSTWTVFFSELYKCSGAAARIPQGKRRKQLLCLCWACAVPTCGLTSSVSRLRSRVGLRDARLSEVHRDLVQRLGRLTEVLCALLWMRVRNPGLDHLRRTVPRKVNPTQHG